jgi:ubiquinone/menaquinone biosynthesis C-methylase UbiE
MSSQAQMEIGFWRELYRQLGRDGFLAQRAVDFEDFKTNLPELAETLRTPSLKLLEVGTGLISPLETYGDLKAEVTAVDPLMNQYNEIHPLGGRPVNYIQASGEELPFENESFDAVSCLNVIDHTPYPHKMLEEIIRVLKPGGKFFFEVNFDEALSPAHYGIWDKRKVEEFFGVWKPVVERTDYRAEHNQTRYWAVFVK